MKKYFYTDGIDKFGPFSFEELKDKGITKETKVWFQDIVDWIPAGKVEELKNLFQSEPPPIEKEKKEFSDILIKNNSTGVIENVTLQRWNDIIKYYGKEKFSIISYLDENGNKIRDNSILVEKKRPPKTYLAESILVTIFCCLPFGIAGIVNAAKVESRFNTGDFEGANRSSSEARKWMLVGFWIGLAVSVIYTIIMIAIYLSPSLGQKS
jgi:hypothetical protein